MSDSLDICIEAMMDERHLKQLDHLWTRDTRNDWEFCKLCTIIKRADNKNKSCQGRLRIVTRKSLKD